MFRLRLYPLRSSMAFRSREVRGIESGRSDMTRHGLLNTVYCLVIGKTGVGGEETWDVGPSRARFAVLDCFAHDVYPELELGTRDSARRSTVGIQHGALIDDILHWYTACHYNHIGDNSTYELLLAFAYMGAFYLGSRIFSRTNR